MVTGVRCLLLVLPAIAIASKAFLEPLPQEQDSLTLEQQNAVLHAIEKALGTKNRHATEVRIGPIEALLEPTLAALPRNEHGKFGHKAARYALHRLFVQRHAWFVKGIGIDVDGEQETPASMPSMLQGDVPELVQSLFEERFGSHGVDAHEVAVMAATLENLAHMESMERLRTSYSLLRLSPGATNLTRSEVESLLDIYMAGFVTRTNLTALVAMKVEHPKLLAFAKKKYPGWEAVRSFVRQIMDETVNSKENLSFVDVSRVITRIGDKYGRWQAYECDDLKRKLYSIEDDGSGRVSLSKFYSGALNQGHWQFAESSEYLRAAGILDESNPSNPRVIVTNYILSPSNCVAASSFYSVCCLDECEDLLDHLEREIRAPSATPAKIVGLVTGMASSSVSPNHSISASLLARLDQIAAVNGGMVPLHGRLFAQWMHHVYPRECPFPHMPGTTKSMRTADFEKHTGKNATATRNEMEQCIAVTPEKDVGGNDVPWSDEDELFVEHPAFQAEVGGLSLWGIVRFVVFFVPAFSMVLFLMRVGSAAGIEREDQQFSKSHFV